MARTPAQRAASRANLAKARKARQAANTAGAYKGQIRRSTRKGAKTGWKTIGKSKSGSDYAKGVRRGASMEPVAHKREAPRKPNVTVKDPGPAFAVRNGSGQTVRKRNRMDAAAVKQGYYAW